MVSHAAAIGIIVVLVLAGWWLWSAVLSPGSNVSARANQTIESYGLNATAFRNGTLIDIGAADAPPALDSLPQLQQDFESFESDTFVETEKRFFGLLSDLTHWYAQKRFLQQQGAFFETTSNLDALCTRQTLLTSLVDLEQELYLSAVELEADALELSAQTGVRPFELNVQSEFELWEVLKSDCDMLKTACEIR